VRRLVHSAYLLATLALLGMLIVVTQRRLTAAKPVEWQQERLSYLPRSDVLKPVLLGYATTYACYLWIKTANYFGSHYLTDRSFPWLIQMVDMVTKLNPRFDPAYEYAGLFLPDYCSAPLAARVILERGLFHLGAGAWKPCFYTGMLFFKQYGDRRAAAEGCARGALVPGEQAWKLARLSATFYQKAGRADEGRRVLEFIWQTSSDPQVRKVIEEKLRMLAQGR
jgi:hypothetical protein